MGQRDSNILRSKAAGVRLGEDAFTIKFATPQNQTMNFTFNITVLQYFLHESLSNWKHSLNYKTMDKGRVALRTFFLKNKTNPKYLPKTEKWLRQRSWVS